VGVGSRQNFSTTRAPWGRHLLQYNGGNIEGVYHEQEKEKIIRYNEMKGHEVVGYKRSGEHALYDTFQ
jgi:hypothetical protein